ncbi:hypothetical protein BN132_371 [Cronobacter turicensis 564]|nr:hypothetical protein BN132_371 [Cronobacter turicensis 564]
MTDIHALYAGIVGINGGQNIVLQERFQRMMRQRRHRTGLNIRGQAGLNADPLFRQEIHQRRIFHCFHAVADTLGAQLANRLPDALRACGFTGVNGDMPARVTPAVKVIQEQAAGEAQFIARQIQRGDVIAMRQQAFQLGHARLFTKGTAQDADKTGVHAEFAAALTHAVNHGFDYARHRQIVRHRHIARRETQLHVMQTVARGIFHIFVRHTAAGFERAEHLHAPVEFGEKAHQIRFVFGYLYVRAQRLQRIGGQGEIKLAAQVKNGLRADVAVKMAMEVGKGKAGINHDGTLF